tara:strand:- start:479 stop:682 length:204 start_codon:yes stop_codon:yes gene_type:complete
MVEKQLKKEKLVKGRVKEASLLVLSLVILGGCSSSRPKKKYHYPHYYQLEKKNTYKHCFDKYCWFWN